MRGLERGKRRRQRPASDAWCGPVSGYGRRFVLISWGFRGKTPCFCPIGGSRFGDSPHVFNKIPGSLGVFLLFRAEEDLSSDFEEQELGHTLVASGAALTVNFEYSDVKNRGRSIPACPNYTVHRRSRGFEAKFDGWSGKLLNLLG